MPACSLSMAATATAIPTSSSSSSSSSSPFLSSLSFDHLSHTTINFSSKAKPIKPPKLSTHFTNYSPFFIFSRSLCFSASAGGVDGAAEVTQEEDIQNVQPPEAEQQAQESPQEEEEEEEEEEEVEEDEGVESLAVEERRLYVGNLPYSTTSSQLSDLFAEAGRVISVELIYDRVTDRSRGFAFVTMGSVEEANGAIRMFDGSQVGGRTVKVNFPEVPKGGEREVMGPKIRSGYQGFIDSPHKIYAGNLSWSLTSQGLREAFANQPGLLSAKVIYERDSGRSRGYGFVTFASAEEVESALNAMNGVEVEGRPMRLNLSEQKAPASTTPSVAQSNSENELENSEILSSSAPASTPPVAESNSENGLENSEILSSASI